MTAPAKRRVSKLLTTAQVAKLLGDDWSARRVRRMLEREGIGRKSGQYFYVTTLELQCAFPTLANAIELAAAEG